MPGGADLTFRDQVDTALREFAAARRDQLAVLGPEAVGLVDRAEQFVSSGKRLRPLFCRAGWLVAGGEPAEPGLPVAAAAWEWLQGSALVHDDLMDDSDTRRGRPSVHRAAEADHRTAGLGGSASEHGRSVAILLGDLMLSWVDEQLRASRLPGVDAALPLLDRCKTEVVAGQYLDLLAQTQACVDEQQVLRVVEFKSAKYTVERPLHVGAALAGADDSLLHGLSAVALPLGAAFQLRDDVLGVFGEPQATGKPAGDDLREGKRTLLVARAEDLGGPSAQRRVATLLGTSDGVPELRDLIRDVGALASVETEIERLRGEAEAALADLPIDAPGILGPLIATAVQRTA